MKTYFVKTQSSVNPMLLHSTMKNEFATIDINEAYAAFNKEVEALSATYLTAEQFKAAGCEMCESVDNHAIYCSIIAIDSEDEDNVEFIEDSEYFYEK